MKTVKIKPSHESQGDHVVINEADFDPEQHDLLEGEADVEASAEQDTSGEVSARRGRRSRSE